MPSSSKQCLERENNSRTPCLRKLAIPAIQWNLSKANTLGTNIFVRFRQVSALDRLCLWDFYQKTDILGQNILSALEHVHIR